MAEFGAATRRANMQRMAAETVDVCVIGGGVTGAGVALEAASRGASVALIERGDFGSGTSGWSTKLVHGGIRYLPQRQVSLVREALQEQTTLLRIAPHLVWPLDFVLPIYATTRHPIGLAVPFPRGVGVSAAMEAGLSAYDLLAGRKKITDPTEAAHAIGKHRHISAAEAERMVPGLRAEGLKGAFIYGDAGTNDTRLVGTIIRTAAERGAMVANYAEATGLTERAGHLAGVQAQDVLTGDTFTIAARHIVNAGGVWAEKIEGLAAGEPQVSVLPAKGIHLVVAAEKVGVMDRAVVLPETPDGRLIFIVPWQGRAVIGTTDTPGGDIERPRAEADEIAYVLAIANQSVRDPLTEADIISTYAGYRPLVKARNAAKSAALSRTHAVLTEPNGLVTVVGGKLTTYRKMAEDTVDALAKRGLKTGPSVTDHLPLAGADGYGHWERVIASEAGKRGLDAAVADHLLHAYGSDAGDVLALVDADALLAARLVPDLPVIFAEVAHAVQSEMAMTVADVLARRTRLSLLDRARGASVAPDVAAILGDALGWDDAERARQVAHYRATVTDLHAPHEQRTTI